MERSAKFLTPLPAFSASPVLWMDDTSDLTWEAEEGSTGALEEVCARALARENG